MANFVELPREIQDLIFNNFTYDQLSRLRLVNVYFNKICQEHLNYGFKLVIKRHAALVQRLKNILPRRESERRTHLFSRHNEILTAIETRISLLNMTIMKYVSAGQCCFIAGKVLDEFNLIFNEIEDGINQSRQIPRSHDFLTELRDISSMAMEHFDEKIVPMIKRNSNPDSSSSYLKSLKRRSFRNIKTYAGGFIDEKDNFELPVPNILSMRQRLRTSLTTSNKNKAKIRIHSDRMDGLEKTIEEQQAQISSLIERVKKLEEEHRRTTTDYNITKRKLKDEDINLCKKAKFSST